MARVPREAFLPEELRARAYDDRALPLRFGQTISQPYVVAYMCEALALSGGERLLDVGTGSGYGAAVLAELAAEVDTVERVGGLAEQARRALREGGYGRVRVHVGDGAQGLPGRAPFGGIAVAAASRELPAALWEQLDDGARIVIPLELRGRSQRLCVFMRDGGRAALVDSIPARFVPLVR
jgi:protein-L-isoaspartate(D-aspartate) O-methyltransferase